MIQRTRNEKWSSGLRGTAVRVLTLFLLVCAAMCVAPRDAYADASDFTQNEAVDYLNSLVGEYLVGSNGWCNCPDVAKVYYEWLGVGAMSGNGYAYHTGNKPNGWERVYSDPQPGDVAAWGADWGSSGYGHVACVVDVDGGYITVVEQSTTKSQKTGKKPGVPCYYQSYRASSPYSFLRPNFRGGNHNPYGYLDAVDGGTGAIHVFGWAKDPDDENAQLKVHVYVGGPAGGNSEGYEITANKDSGDVGPHRFDAWINVGRTGNQPVYAYGINVGEGNNAELWNCPKYTYITADTEAPRIENVQVSNLTPDGYDVTCDVSDNVGVNYVRFYTWTSHTTNGNNQDDMRMEEQSHGNGRYTCHVNVNDHGGERGVLYYTHIYAGDSVPAHEVGNGAASNIPVPHGMVNYNGNTYLRMDAGPADYHSWGEAQQWCEGAYFSGHLATITSADEQRVISQLIDGGNTHYWIGASDADGEGSWQWVTGEEFSYSNWRSDEPNGGTSENYAGISSADGHWVDLNGNANGYNGYIMELDKFHNLYGEIVTDVEEGVYTINSFDHPEFAVDVTGMSADAHANVELWLDNGTDAQRFQFTKNYIETDDGPIHDGSYTITNVHSGMALDVENASLVSGANVQQYPVNGTNAQKWYIERGPDGSVYLRSRVCDFYLDIFGAYFESGTNIQTWFANNSPAQRFVLKPAANPKAISSKVYDITPNGYKVQVELDAPRGIKFVEFPTWSLANQTDIRWDRGSVDGNTATFEVKTSNFGNRHGLYWTHVYVTDSYGKRCWVDAEQNDVLVPEKVASVGDKTYFLVPADMSWDDAKRASEKFGDLIGCNAHLATVTSAEEQEIVTNLVSAGERTEYWIGASDEDEEGTWRWIDGTSLDGYDNWADGEPNGGADENYLGVNRADGLWNDEYTNAYNTKGVGFIAEVEGDDRCAPTISDVRVTDLDETGYTVTCTIKDPSGVSKVEFPTWVPERGEVGDDAVWKEGDLYEDSETGDVVAEFRVSTTDHNNAKGQYETHIYATDKLGNKTPVYKLADTNGKVEHILVPNATYASQTGVYHRFDHAGKWTDAKACVEAMPIEGASLATVANEADDDALASLLAGAGKSAYWLGLSDAEGSGAFTWADGGAVGYDHWASGQPGTYTGSRYGAVLASNGKWYGYTDAGVNMNSDLMGFVVLVGYSEEELCPDGHTWGEWTTVVEPTCSKVGYRERICDVCGESDVEQLARTDHDPLEAAHENEVAATCSEDGSYDSVTVCSRCGDEISRETVTVNKLGHSPADPVEENRVEPTCSAEGSCELVSYCQVCGEVASRETKAIPKAEHAWNEGQVTTAPTCTEPGERVLTCTACGQTRTEEVAAKGHKPGEPVVENQSVGNTCTEGGTYDEVVYCETCHEELSREQKTQPAGQHVAVTDAAVAPTCTKDGLTEGSHCQVCGAVIVAQEPIARTGHREEDVAAVAPTCTEPGATAGKRCKTCGEVLEGCEPIAARGHDYQQTVVAPTCSQFGYTEHKCSRCDDAYVTDRVPAKAHTAGEAEVDSEVPATCEAQGSKVLVTKCADCGKELYRTTEVTQATGHAAGEPTVESQTAATCEAAGRRVLVTKCATCQQEMSRTTEVMPAKGHTAGNPVVESETAATCENGGSRTLVTRCESCDKELSRKMETIPAIGHSWDEGKVTKEATCTEPGTKTFTCNTCKGTRTERIPSGNHKPGGVSRENEVASTCKDAGHYEAVTHCESCGIELSRSAVPLPLSDHTWGDWSRILEPTYEREGMDMRTCEVCHLSETRPVDKTPEPAKVDLKDATIGSIPAQTYTGKALTPRIVVTLAGKDLIEGTDYVVSYANNTNAGTATVTVTGRGGYEGSKSVTFTISKAAQTITASDKVAQVKKTVSLGARTSGNGKLTYKSSNTKVAKVDASGVVTGVKAGTAKITVTAAETGQYCKATKTVTVTVKRANTMTAKAKRSTVAASLKTLKGKAVTLASNVSVSKAKGAVSYSNVSSNTTAKRFKVNARSGKVTVPKGTKKGRYQVKVKVTAKGNGTYLSGTKTVTFYVRVK